VARRVPLEVTVIRLSRRIVSTGCDRWIHDIVTVEGVDPETGDATFTTILDPLYKKCEDFELGFNEDNGYAGSEDCCFFVAVGEEKGFFTISGPTEDCDDVGLAFDADGLVMGSIG